MNNLVCGLLACALGGGHFSNTRNWNNAEVTPLTVINTPNMEYLPSLSANDETLFFVSDKQTDVPVYEEHKGRRDVPDNSQNVWMAHRADDGSYGGDIFSYGDVNRVLVNDGSVSRGIGDWTYLFASGDTRESLGETDIYSLKVTRPDGNVVVVETDNIGANINSPYRDETPAIGPDGTLYFSSNRPGGMGGTDIWFCRYNRSTGTWDQAENAGAAINTADDELAPTVSPDGKFLVFTSKGQRPSFGGYDLFISTLVAPGKALAPVNLGRNINSSGSEMGACFAKSGDVLYFASDRSSNFDLYKAQLPEGREHLFYR